MAKVLHALADKLVQRGYDLDPGEAAPHHHKGEQRLLHGRVTLNIGLLKDVNHVVPQPQGVTEILEGQGMLSEAWLAHKARHIAQRQHQVVILQEGSLCAKTSWRRDALSVEVDRL